MVTWCAEYPKYGLLGSSLPVFFHLSNGTFKLRGGSCIVLFHHSREGCSCLLYHISALADAWQWLSYLSGGKCILGSLLLPCLSGSAGVGTDIHFPQPRIRDRNSLEAYMTQVLMPVQNPHLNLIRGGY